MITVADALIVAQQTVALITDRIVGPLIVLFVGILIGKIVDNTLRAFLSSIELDEHATRYFGRNSTVTDLVSGGVAAVIYTISVVWALHEAKILSWIAIGIGIFLAFIIIFSLLLWLRDVVPNVFARLGKTKYRVNQKVEIAGIKGTVQRCGALGVYIRGTDDLEYHIPWVRV